MIYILTRDKMVIEKVKVKKKNSTLSRYLFEENNSGGFYRYLADGDKTDDDIKYDTCVIEAYSVEEAIKIFEDYFKCDLGYENKTSCECC